MYSMYGRCIYSGTITYFSSFCTFSEHDQFMFPDHSLKINNSVCDWTYQCLQKLLSITVERKIITCTCVQINKHMNNTNYVDIIELCIIQYSYSTLSCNVCIMLAITLTVIKRATYDNDIYSIMYCCTDYT